MIRGIGKDIMDMSSGNAAVVAVSGEARAAASHPRTHTNAHTNARTLTEERALVLLGSGVAPAMVAASLGVSESLISQLLSNDAFATEVAELRFESLQKHNRRDSDYDKLEDALLEKMQDCVPLMHRPMEILKAISVVNAAKRRGQSTPESITNKQQVIQLQIPVQVINKFSTNLSGQVTSITDSENVTQQLITIQSGALGTLLKERKNEHENALLPGDSKVAGGD